MAKKSHCAWLFHLEWQLTGSSYKAQLSPLPNKRFINGHWKLSLADNRTYRKIHVRVVANHFVNYHSRRESSPNYDSRAVIYDGKVFIRFINVVST